MNRRLCWLLFATLAALLPAGAAAQGVRAPREFYVYPQTGFFQYTGDRDPRLAALSDGHARAVSGPEEGAPGFPWGAAVELGYGLTPGFSLGAGMGTGFFPTAVAPREGGEGQSFLGKLVLRYTFVPRSATAAPFIEGGAFGATGVGKDREGGSATSALAAGPWAGIGLDIALADRASVMLGLQALLALGDEAFDGSAGSGATPAFDLLNFLSIGLKFGFGPQLVAPEITRLHCPEDLTAGQQGSFRAELHADAAQPVDLRWSFGAAGGTGAGTSTSYTFDQPGLYTVTATATNRAGEDARSCTVTVTRPPQPGLSPTLTAMPNRACVGEPIAFSAQLSQDSPLTYTWDFGNGQAAQGLNPATTYDRPGSYTVTLTASDTAGTAITRSMTVTILDCEANCAREIVDLNAVYFSRNSADLTDQGRAFLRENIAVLLECLALCLRIDGWASPRERSPVELSERRARAVAEFYRAHGIAPSRLTIRGRGATSHSSGKEGASASHRADSVPLPCEDMNP